MSTVSTPIHPTSIIDQSSMRSDSSQEGRTNYSTDESIRNIHSANNYLTQNQYNRLSSIKDQDITKLDLRDSLQRKYTDEELLTVLRDLTLQVFVTPPGSLLNDLGQMLYNSFLKVINDNMSRLPSQESANTFMNFFIDYMAESTFPDTVDSFPVQVDVSGDLGKLVIRKCENNEALQFNVSNFTPRTNYNSKESEALSNLIITLNSMDTVADQVFNTKTLDLANFMLNESIYCQNDLEAYLEKNSSISESQRSLIEYLKANRGKNFLDLIRMRTFLAQLEAFLTVNTEIQGIDGLSAIARTYGNIDRIEDPTIKQIVRFIIRNQGANPTDLVNFHKHILDMKTGNVIEPCSGQEMSFPTLNPENLRGFSRIIGYESLKTSLQQAVIEPIKSSLSSDEDSSSDVADLFISSSTPQSTKLASGLLLAGPPGNGKTFMMSSLADEITAIDNRLKATTMEFTLGRNGGGVINQTANNLSKKIQDARDIVASDPEGYTYVVFVIDEINSLIPDRSNSSRPHSEDEKSVTTILQELDRKDGSNRNIIFVGASNYPDQLDQAACRNGRLGTKLYIGNPDRISQKMLIQEMLKSYPHIVNLDIDSVLDQLNLDCSVSLIKELVDQAEASRISKRRLAITDEDFVTALKIINIPNAGSTKKFYDSAKNAAIRVD
jgi:hypothetical protein